ncbi:MAG: two-component regulator propeller domain-containing protein, partial [Bacteroidota bacterium]
GSKGEVFMFANSDGLWRNNGKQLTQFFIQYDGQKFSPTSMYKDNQGTLWLGTASQGIYKYNGSAFEKFTLER